MFSFLQKSKFVIFIKTLDLVLQLILLSNFVLFPIFNNQLTLFLDPWMGYSIATVFPYYFIVQAIRLFKTKKKLDLYLLITLFLLPLILGLVISNLGKFYFLNDIKIGKYVTNDYNFSRLATAVSLLTIILYYTFYFCYSIYNFYKYLRGLKPKTNLQK